jgi:hypothetical protein
MDLLQYDIPIWILLAYMVFMAAVQALPRPSETSSARYTWLFQFLHLLSANIKIAADPRKRENGKGEAAGE